MTESNMEPVQGGKVLSTLIDLFFKGLKKAFSEDAKYEEEKGVLKQINEITIQNILTNKEYKMTIKLSPVKDKTDQYYIEAETDAPKLNLSAINKKVVKLDDSNIKEFRKLIDDMLSKSNYVAKMDRSDQDNESSKTEDEKTIDQTLDAVEERFNTKVPVAVLPDGTSVRINVEFDSVSDNYCTLKLYVSDISDPDEIIDSVKGRSVEIRIKDSSNKIITADKLFKRVNDEVVSYVDDNKMTNRHYINSSTNIVHATFVKKDNKIQLRAIEASSNIEDTILIVDDLINDEDFANSIEEGQSASFDIEDLGDSYNIEETQIDETHYAVCDMYKAINSVQLKTQLIEFAIGPEAFHKDELLHKLSNSLVELQSKISLWVSSDPNVLVALMDPFDTPAIDDVAFCEDDYDLAEVENEVISSINNTIIYLTMLSSNLKEDEQSELTALCNKIKELII